MSSVKIGMIGGGTVGGGVYQALSRNGGLVTERTGVAVTFKKIAVKAFDEPRAVEIPQSLLTIDWHDVVNDPEIEIVIELMGGTGLAKEIILSALRKGKAVVTANKALLSACGEELFKVAAENHAGLYYEASVAGGIPIIRAVKEAFVCNHFPCISGIVNGTCNYILTEMEAQGRGFEEVLKEAQRKGYAESNPGLDVDGHDAHHKISILASLAHNAWVDPQRVYREGIRSVTNLDISISKKLGYAIKLLGSIKSIAHSSGEEVIQAGVAPTLVPLEHILAKVSGVFNGVWVHGDVVGETFFYGRGAGQDATASAVVGDIADAAINRVDETPERLVPMCLSQNVKVVDPSEVESSFYLRAILSEEGEKKLKEILQRRNIPIQKSQRVELDPVEKDLAGVICVTGAVARGKVLQAIEELKSLSLCKGEPVAFEIMEG